MSSVQDNDHDTDEDDEYEWVEPYTIRMMREEKARNETLRLQFDVPVSSSDLIRAAGHATDSARNNVELMRASYAPFNNSELIASAQRINDAMTGTGRSAESAISAWKSSGVAYIQQDLAWRQQIKDQIRFAQGWTRVPRKRQHTYSPHNPSSPPAQPAPSPTIPDSTSLPVASTSDDIPAAPQKRKRGNPSIKPWMAKERYKELMRDYVVENQKLPSRPVFARFVEEKEMRLEKTWFTRYARIYFEVTFPEFCLGFKGLIALD